MHKELLVDLLEKYPRVKWNDIIGMRNVISHAYMEIDHNVIYKTCKIPLTCSQRNN